ncbi:RHOMBOID-like protein 12 [Cucumis melo var. makuwa]|uniref:RHOMBOID-like protein 12 n=1 Tax=Cucumis melo var. makuwa TaxID=1194695 RepID=A0A5A7V1Y4_CUCMM|nr:RHOMBOID-like protein 12 [Cucumis melo var. makuwa]
MASDSFIDKNVVFKRLKPKSENKIGSVFGSEFLLKLYLAGAIGGSAFYLAHHLFQASSSKSRSFWGNDPVRAQGLVLFWKSLYFITFSTENAN